MTTSVSLADIATRIDVLEIRCSRCDRTGRRHVSKLIEQHGGSMRLPDLRMKMVQGCDHADGHDYDTGELITSALVIGTDMHKILQAVAFKRSREEGGRPSVSKVVRLILESHRAELEKEAGKFRAMWD